MDKQQSLKLLGAAIGILMITSMFAMALLYSDREDDSQPNLNIDPSLQPTATKYTVNFDANVLKELSSLKLFSKTVEMDIQKIDRSIMAIDGIRNIRSNFTTPEDKTWIYTAELTIKKDYSLNEIISKIQELEYFEEIQPVKYVTITAPNTPIIITNKTLGIDKNYSFETDTLSAIVDINTMPKDKISISGNMSLQGNTITSLELYEMFNYNNPPEFDLNSLVIDTNSLMNDIDSNNPNIDSNDPNIDSNDPNIDSNDPNIDSNDPNIDSNDPNIDSNDFN
jgi:hypothetical protein